MILAKYPFEAQHFALQNLQSLEIFLAMVNFFITVNPHFKKQLFLMPFFFNNFEEWSNLHLILNHHLILRPFSFLFLEQQSNHHLLIINPNFFCFSINYFQQFYLIEVIINFFILFKSDHFINFFSLNYLFINFIICQKKNFN